MVKYILTAILVALVIVSYLLGVLAFSSKEARNQKWQEYYQKYEGKIKKKDL